MHRIAVGERQCISLEPFVELRIRMTEARLGPKPIRDGDGRLLCMGLFSIFCIGSRPSGGELYCLEPHTPATSAPGGQRDEQGLSPYWRTRHDSNV